MQVLFEAPPEPQARALRDLADQRVRHVLRRLAWLVPRVRVRLSDVNGPHGGIDKRCQVELRTGLGSPLVITSLAADWRQALDNALARAVHTLRRLWQRHRVPQRLPQRARALP